MHLLSYIVAVDEAAKANGWILSQNTFDALVDMSWNVGQGSLEYLSNKMEQMSGLKILWKDVWIL